MPRLVSPPPRVSSASCLLRLVSPLPHLLCLSSPASPNDLIIELLLAPSRRLLGTDQREEPELVGYSRRCYITGCCCDWGGRVQSPSPPPPGGHVDGCRDDLPPLKGAEPRESDETFRGLQSGSARTAPGHQGTPGMLSEQSRAAPDRVPCMGTSSSEEICVLNRDRSNGPLCDITSCALILHEAEPIKG